MSPEIVGLTGIGLLMVIMFAGMNIGLAMAAVGFAGFAYLTSWNIGLGALGTTPYVTIAFYPLTAIPLFVLMGAVVSQTGVGSDLYNSAYKWIGQVRGGLAIATIAACALFAAICGSSSAETLTIGRVTLPEMKKYKYDDTLATGSVAAGGTLGILIPPSIGFLLYGIITEQSIGYLFMAGILPGVLLSSMFIATIMLIVWIRPDAGPAGPRTSFREKVVSLKGTWTVLALFLLVLGGIYLGIFTPTEAGAVGAFGAIVITFASRKLKFKNLIGSIVDAGTTTAMILILIIGAFVFMKFLTVSQLPFFLASTIADLNLNKYVIFTVIVFVYIILGMFLDINSAIVITVPLLLPVVTSIGFDPIWFGVIVVILMEMGLVTPPVGMNVFIMSSITDVPMGTIFKGIWPFVGAMIICIIILTIWPQIALFIPNNM